MGKPEHTIICMSCPDTPHDSIIPVEAFSISGKVDRHCAVHSREHRNLRTVTLIFDDTDDTLGLRAFFKWRNSERGKRPEVNGEEEGKESP